MNNATILLVDDETDLLSLWTFRLEGAGYQVITAQSGEEAIAAFSACVPNLVITDLRMGGMDGMALYDGVRKLNQSIPVIIITAHGSIPEAVEATKRGVFSFLTKPIDGRELLQEIKKALVITGSVGSNDASEGWRSEIVTKSSSMETLLGKAKLVAPSLTSVMIRGESGTGKELLARAIHMAGDRADKPFVAVNCSAIPEPLLESELFGHAKGSFTGADRDYIGLFRSAEGGTLFLDEIGDMIMPLQVKILRVIQERQVRPVGDSKTVPVDVRIISATHQELEKAISEKKFREDLFYRLNVVSLTIPPLRERREDIPLLVDHFIALLNKQNKRNITGFTPDAMHLLLEASWPGNIRQLSNVVEQSVAFTTTDLIPANLLSQSLQEESEKILTFDESRREFELRYLVKLLQMTSGNVAHSARIAGRNRTDFYKILTRHHIVPSLFKKN
jgi:two-component system, NtrC family, response regulator GlrR